MVITHHAELDVAIQHEADLAATGVSVRRVACAGALCGCTGGEGWLGWWVIWILLIVFGLGRGCRDCWGVWGVLLAQGPCVCAQVGAG